MSNIYWKAVYKDGGELPQYNKDGSVNKYPDIDRAKLEFFELWNGNKLLFRLHLEEGRRLIYRRRVSRALMSNFTDVVYLIGWQQTINGVNIQDIAYIFGDGCVELAGKWKDYRMFHAPNLIDCEKEGANG